MRILSCTVENFGSYKRLEFNFTSQGLTLVSGPTGAGKSTLFDVVPWILFGTTAKNGAVDEVRSWPGDKVTSGVLELDGITVVRHRGAPKDNDLHFWTEDSLIIRGKDLVDTQKLLNEALGLTAETYLAGAYFHEFSATASFFTATAKIRRQITEQLVDLSLAKKVATGLADYRKLLKKELETETQSLALVSDRLEYQAAEARRLADRAERWERTTTAKLLELQEKSANFEANKKHNIERIETEHRNKTIELEYDIDAILKLIEQDDFYEAQWEALRLRKEHLGSDKCASCGAPKNVEKTMLLERDLHKLDADRVANDNRRIQGTRLGVSLEKHLATLAPKIAQEAARENAYAEQLVALKAETNPYTEQLRRLEEETAENEHKSEALKSAILDFTDELNDIELLTQVTADFRGACILRAITYLETQTNKLLTDHFDAEIRVKFDVADADKLEVEVSKDGNACTYSQLSKGQRQLLKLCFGVAVMKCVSNHSGVKFSAIMLDEPTDGCDEDFKLKSYGLLEQLAAEYESVFVIDHNEAFKSMFTKRYDVTLVDGKSQIEEA